MHCYLTPGVEPLRLDPETATAINKNWQRFIEWRGTSENATLCRLIEANNETLMVATDVTYKDVVGTRWQRRVAGNQFMVVSALAIVRTSEGNLMLQPRDSGDWDYSLECPGGFIRAAYLEDGQLSVSDFIKERVASDVHLRSEHIATCQYLTTHEAKGTLEHTLVYSMTLSLNRTELEEVNPYITVLPPDYTPNAHPEFTTIPLHPPSQNVLLATQPLQKN